MDFEEKTWGLSRVGLMGFEKIMPWGVQTNK